MRERPLSRKRLARGATRFAQPYRGASDDVLLAEAAADEDRADRLGQLYRRDSVYHLIDRGESVTPSHFEGAWETMSVRSRP